MRHLFIIIILFLVSSSIVNAHPGRTDSSGGHTCRTNCASWGLKDEEYHFHNSSSGNTAQVNVETPRSNTNPVLTRRPSPKPTLKIGNQNYKVLKILNKDTFTVNINGKTEKIKMLKLDCKSKKTIKDLIGQNIKLTEDKIKGNKDRSGNLLRYVHYSALNVCK